MTGAMRRPVLRILLNAATVLSLVLCVVTVAAWVRSYQARDYVWWSLVNPRRVWTLDTYRGGLVAKIIFAHEIDDFLPRPGVGWERTAPVSYIKPRRLRATASGWIGFAFSLDGQDIDVLSDRRWVACPYWFITLLTAILPGARLAGGRQRARRSRMHPSLCRHCGYDCRATPDRCPECGTPVAAG
jgi:hypothetical protein